jgi:nucleoid-associated protein Lsr2
MAQKVQVLLVDDLDEGKADETVEFGLDGVSYEIDLSAKNAAKLRDALAGYVGAARRAGPRGGTRRRGRSRASADNGSAREVREWARANGHQVSDRGRVPAEVMEAYRAAH